MRHVSSCQPPTVCICVHLANSREKYFFFHERSLLGSSETNFRTVAVPIDSNSLMFQKKPGFYFPLNFWHVLSYHIISYPDASKTKRREVPACTVHIAHESSLNTLHLFTASILLFHLRCWYSSIKSVLASFKTLQALQQGFLILGRKRL